MQQRTLLDKLIILNRARKTGNVAQTCREFGISRISYYHIKKSVTGFVLQSQSPPGADPEAIIEEMTLAYPDLSTVELSKKLLSDHDIQMSHTTVHGKLKNLNLNQSEQRWRHLENQFKYSASADQLSVRQRLFMQKHNPCFSAYHSNLSRPFEQLNLDVIKFAAGRIGIAVDPATNYAFALAMPKMDRKQIIDWLDAEVFPKAREMELPVKTAATSDLKVFDENLDGATDYDAFADLMKKHDLQRIDQHAMKPVLDGSIRHFYDLLAPFLEQSPAPAAEELAAWMEDYNHGHEYPYYPTYGLSPAAMVDYYRKYGKNWRGIKSLGERLRGYISPAPALGAKKTAPSHSKQVNSVYSSVVSLFFK